MEEVVFYKQLLIQMITGRMMNKIDLLSRLPESIARRFEDGTPNFLGILSVQYGFEALEEVGGLEAINIHTSIVVSYL